MVFRKYSTILLVILILAFFGCNQTKNVDDINVERIIEKTETKKVPEIRQPTTAIPQFVMLSFDGSRSPQMWQNTLEFAQKMKENGKPLKFTYFISGVYFIPEKLKELYHPPKNPVGESGIGFADNEKDIVKRIKYINQAVADGHEIASHANGHFDGSGWSLEDWQQEFSQFNELIFNFAENNELGGDEIKLNLAKEDIVGFRAPVLGKNDNLWPALKENGFRYDASQTAVIGSWPNKMSNGLWNFPLASLPIAHTTKHALSMDYNFYYTQTGAKDILKKNTTAWKKAFQEVVDTYLYEFDYNYKGNRAPVIIGHHFSVWNDSLYWEALKDFASQVCGKPDVKCATFKEMADYLDANPKKP